jgi:snRNA-activating protein complex subunit 3
MDHIYPTKDYRVYKIKDEIEKLSTSLQESKMPLSFEDISNVTGISHERLKQISLDLCATYEDYGNDELSEAEAPFTSFPEAALELNCVKAIREGNLVFKEQRVKDVSKFVDKSGGNSSRDLEVFKDSLITVRFYEPFKYTPSMKNQPRFHQEYQVLGSNFLNDLREKFYCVCNFGPFFDISENPRHIPEFESDTTDPGFFFIHDTFYNDTRNQLNPDYSEVIRDWFKRLTYVHDFKTAVMQDTKFEDLQIRVGYPCVYQHHGACEHIFCITSVDLLDYSGNSLNKSDYPKLSNSSRKRSTLCDICGQCEATFLVTNCPLHVKDPMRCCDNCFFTFHYTSDGESKTCSFNAYRIFSVRPEKN